MGRSDVLQTSARLGGTVEQVLVPDLLLRTAVTPDNGIGSIIPDDREMPVARPYGGFLGMNLMQTFPAIATARACVPVNQCGCVHTADVATITDTAPFPTASPPVLGFHGTAIGNRYEASEPHPCQIILSWPHTDPAMTPLLPFAVCSRHDGVR